MPSSTQFNNGVNRACDLSLLLLCPCFHFTGPFAFFSSTAAFYSHSADDLLEFVDLAQNEVFASLMRNDKRFGEVKETTHEIFKSPP